MQTGTLVFYIYLVASGPSTLYGKSVLSCEKATSRSARLRRIIIITVVVVMCRPPLLQALILLYYYHSSGRLHDASHHIPAVGRCHNIKLLLLTLLLLYWSVRSKSISRMDFDCTIYYRYIQNGLRLCTTTTVYLLRLFVCVLFLSFCTVSPIIITLRTQHRLHPLQLVAQDSWLSNSTVFSTWNDAALSRATLSWSYLAHEWNCSREARALPARHFLLIIILYILVGSNLGVNVVFL